MSAPVSAAVALETRSTAEPIRSNTQSAITQLDERTRWLAWRRAGIGGTDAAAILGVSPWRSALDVYLDKRGNLEDAADNASMRWGRALEPVIADAYSEQTGIVFERGLSIVHPQHEELRGSLDGLAADRVVEIKTARTAEGWGEPGSDEVPVHYAAQAMHYLLLTGKALVDFAVLIGGSDFRIYTIERDEPTIELLRERELAFWREHVVPGIPPPATTARDARARWPLSRSATVQVDIDVVQALQRLREAKAQMRELERDIEAAESIVLPAFGEAEAIADGDTLLATWKTQKASRFDTTAFRKAHPDLAAAFTHESTSRVLRLK